MRAFPHTNVLVYLFDADNPTRRDQATALLAHRQEDLGRPAAGRKRPALKRHPGRFVILCVARDTIHGHAPSLLYGQHAC